MSGSRAPFTSSYHDISVPAPFENFTDEYVDLVETVEANLPKITSQEGALPDASGDNQDHMFITANTSGNPMGIFVSDGSDFVKQSLDTPEVEADTVTVGGNLTADSVDVTTQLTDGSGNTVVDTSGASADNTLQNASLDGSNVTNSNGNSIVNTTSDELQNITVPESTLNFTGLSDGGTVTGTITMTNSLVFDRGNDDTDKVEIVDVTSAAESASADSVANPALEVRQPDNSDADLRVTGTIKEV